MRVADPVRRVTQAEVAQLAGCSQNTVALALRDSKRISIKRRQQIRKLATQLGYRPNIAARSLTQQRSGLVGLFTGTLDHVRTQIASQLIYQLHSTRYRPILGVDESRPKPWYKAPWIESFQDFRVEALVAVAWTDEVELPPWYRQIPLVLAGIQPDPTLPCDFVGLDRMQAGRTATRYLMGRGHERIIAVANLPHRLVVQGYAAAMREAHLPTAFAAVVTGAWPTHDAEIEALVNRFKQAERPTAAVVVNSLTALHLCEALERANLRVPQDVAVIGYDPLPMADHLRILLTTIEQPVAALAEQIVDVTQQRLANPEAPLKHIVLDHELVVRAST